MQQLHWQIPLMAVALAALGGILLGKLAERLKAGVAPRIALAVLPAILAGGLAAVLLPRDRPPPRDPLAAFDADFDRNLRQFPIAARLAEHDKTLHDQIFRSTRAAFIAGGWPAARETLLVELERRVSIYADDAHLLAERAAVVLVLRKLRSEPARCKDYLMNGGAPDEYPEARAEVLKNKAASDAVLEDAAGRFLDPAVPRLKEPSDDEIDRIVDSLTLAPVPMTLRESQAFWEDTKADPGDLCDATIKYDENILTLPQAEGAHALRVLAADFRDWNWKVRRRQLDADAKPPPAGFACAAPGTRFVLTATTPAGTPVVQLSLGRRGFTCALYSTGSGYYAWLGGLEDSRCNCDDEAAMRQLWPLRVGTVREAEMHAHAGTEKVRYSVVWEGEYAVPAGRFHVFEIDVEYSWHGGRWEYRSREFWCPALGWKVAHRFERIAGPPLDGTVTIDWSLSRIIELDQHADLGRAALPG